MSGTRWIAALLVDGPFAAADQPSASASQAAESRCDAGGVVRAAGGDPHKVSAREAFPVFSGHQQEEVACWDDQRHRGRGLVPQAASASSAASRDARLNRNSSRRMRRLQAAR